MSAQASPTTPRSSAWPISLTDSTTSTALRSAFANGIADRIERDEAVMAQVRNQSEGQVMHGLFPKKVPDAVLYDLSDHEKQSMPYLGDEETGRRFALLILKLLAGRSSNGLQAT